MSAMIISVNNEFRVGQCLSQFGITTNVFAKSVSDLNDSTNVAAVSPFHAGDGKAVIAPKFESLRCAHLYIWRQATARSWRAQAASRSNLFRILPEPPFGSSVSENSMLRGTLKLASDRRQYAISSSAVSVFPGLRTTQAFTISPHFGSGIPKTATSRTAGCV